VGCRVGLELGDPCHRASRQAPTSRFKSNLDGENERQLKRYQSQERKGKTVPGVLPPVLTVQERTGAGGENV